MKNVLGFLFDLLVLTKYRITGVAIFTGYTAIAVEGHYATDLGHIWPCLVALFLTGGSANTLNQVFELEKDAVMNRTKSRRPLPAGRISTRQAVWFAVVQFIAAIALLVLAYPGREGWLAALLVIFTIVYYSFFYTLYLKPKHWTNIIIGGVPGAMGPLIAWAAMAGELAWEPVAMFSLIFLWTPPHVWALAIKLKDDYARAGIPMLPVVKGVDETTRQIFIYTVIMFVGSLALPLATAHGSWWESCPVYLSLAAVLGVVFLVWAWLLWVRRPMMPTMPLFRYSILYISALFLAMIIDAAYLRRGA